MMQQQQQQRPGSVASIQTMVTAPMTPRQLPTQSTSTGTNGSLNNRPPSVMSVNNNIMRSRSSVSTSSRVLGQPSTFNNTRAGSVGKQPQHMMTGNTSTNTNSVLSQQQQKFINEEELFDDSVNPWQHIPPSNKQHRRRSQSGTTSEDSIENTSSSRIDRLRRTPSNSHLRLPSPMYNKQQHRQLSSPSPTPLYFSQQQQQLLQSMTPIHHPHTNIYQQSPVPGSSTSSSVTATPQLLNNMLMNQHERNVHTPTSITTTGTGAGGGSRSNSRNRNFPPAMQQQPSYTTTTSVVALGPATKRALESLQNEVIALNDRIDDLRRELVERDKQRAAVLSKRRRSSSNSGEEEEDDEFDEGWKWVIKVREDL